MVSLKSKFVKRYFSIPEYAEEKNLSRKSVKALIDDGKLKVVLVGKREKIVEEELTIIIPMSFCGAATERILRYNSRHPELQSALA